MLSSQLNSLAIAKQGVPDILLAEVYASGLDAKQYLVSEKYDGERAMWDGKALTLRPDKLM